MLETKMPSLSLSTQHSNHNATTDSFSNIPLRISSLSTKNTIGKKKDYQIGHLVPSIVTETL